MLIIFGLFDNVVSNAVSVMRSIKRDGKNELR